MRIRITFEQTVDDNGATQAQTEEWAQWITGYRSDIQTTNPLVDVEISADQLDWRLVV